MRLLVAEAAHAWLGPGDELAGCSLMAEDGFVTRIGTPDATWPEPDETLDARDCLVLPGLVNTHHHLYQTLTRAFTPALSLDLFGWLRTLYPVWARLDEEAVYESAWVGLAELLLSGCTTSSDHLYLHPRGQERLVDAEIRAATELGIRFTATRGSMSLSEKDGGLPPDTVVQDDDSILADSERVVRRFHDPSAGSMVQVALAPCSPFTVTPELMQASAALARSLGVRLHTHLAETQNENEYCAEVYGCTPYELAERLEWLAPDVWLAHAVWTSDTEAGLLARTGTGVAHCPTSNMVLGAGVFPTTRVLAEGGRVGLGCDGSASNDASNIWQEVRQAMLLAKLRSGANGFSARDALALATVGGAAVLGRADIGRLAAGMCADVVCIPLDGLSTAGAALDPVEAAVRCAVPAPRHVVVAGAVAVRDGMLAVPGVEAHAARHRAIAKEWAAAAG